MARPDELLDEAELELAAATLEPALAQTHYLAAIAHALVALGRAAADEEADLLGLERRSE